MLSELDQPVKMLTGVGERRASVLEGLDVRTIDDLLHLLPRRYIDRSVEALISALPEGQEATVVGQVVSTESIPGRRPRTQMTVADESGRLTCVWFGRFGAGDRYEPGDWVAVAGKLNRYQGLVQMVHPEVEPLSGGDDEDRLHTGRVIPLYKTTEDLKLAGLSTRTLRRLIRSALDTCVIEDVVPVHIREEAGLLTRQEALSRIHFPEDLADVECARESLAFAEALEVQLWVLRSRRNEPLAATVKVKTPGDLASRAIDALDFDLTGAQQRALDEIWSDLSTGRSMQRLLQGDVGSGKTLVAVLAALPIVEAGGQVAIMAPTEVLAAQHGETLRRLLGPLDLQICVVTGIQTKVEREASGALIASGRVPIVVGTHTLIQEGAVFKDLQLVVIDEQHRFGVDQRSALREKGVDERGPGPHVLVMTATPIPRSLSLTLYGHLDVTVIDELPPGRQSIATGWRRTADRNKALAFVKDQVALGRQAYLIYPLVEESSGSETRAAVETHVELQNGVFSGLRVGLLHGRMKSMDKLGVMDRFRSGEVDVLVSTTVVEVGVDVPNATVMLVEHAERFGLSQLHQLRGRVGRGLHASYCILVVDPEGELTEDALERLEAMSRTGDGFEIAEEDLRIRGSGQLFGTRQAGMPEFRFVDLGRHVHLLEDARELASRLLNSDPELASYPVLAGRVARLELAGLRVPTAG